MAFLVLAPMAGFTHSAFRRLARRLGADWTWSELISVRMILAKGLDDPLLHLTPEERPIRIQLHGNDPEEVFQAAELVLKHLRPDGLDLNAGCPAPKVIRTGSGAALLKDLDRLYHVARALAAACAAQGVEASVKFRLGFAEDRLEEIATTLLQAGIKALALHARLAREFFSGHARWARIRDLKRLVGNDALVIGNGDVSTMADIQKMFTETGCDGVMIGRAALGRPWIFREWQEGHILEWGFSDRIRLLEHLWQDLMATKTPEGALKALKVLIPKMFKGLPGRKKLVGELLSLKDAGGFWQRLQRLKDASRDPEFHRAAPA